MKAALPDSITENFMSNTNKQIRLAHYPEGLPADDTWKLVDGEIPQPTEGQFVVRNHYISLDPAMRGWIRDVRSYLPPVQIDEVMRAGAVGEVVESKNDGFRVGTKVQGVFGVQQYAVSDGKGVSPVDDSVAELPLFLATLGMPGMTAYFGLLEIGQPKEGDTVVVSAASGAVGQVVGQIAKIKGCRVVGIAGGPEKCSWVVDELGFDACIDYKNEDVGKGLKEHCPDRIDVYFDNVGGKILDECLKQMNLHGRIPTCGLISQYNATEPVPGPYNYDLILMHRLKIQGFIILDYMDRYPEATEALIGWMKEGRLKARLDVSEGLETALQAVKKLYTGENTGKLMVRVKDV